MSQTPPDFTELISLYSKGDREALEKLFPIVYEQLRKIAYGQMNRGREQTLAPTALVHEAFLKLGEKEEFVYKNRGHFFAVAARCMRWILMDRAKARRREKRGGSDIRVTFNDEVHNAQSKGGVDIVALDEALQRLAEHDKRLCQVVELRYLAGLSIEEAAEAMSVSPATVKRDWTLAKAWLHRELTEFDEAA